uniref:Uncharacterized protein n=1 Tax=Parascaris equorum TaxID=6256 RepID=A0A914R9C9_PAREQ
MISAKKTHIRRIQHDRVPNGRISTFENPRSIMNDMEMKMKVIWN